MSSYDLLERLLKRQLARRDELMKEVFVRPPATYEAFQNQVGRYEELSREIGETESLLRGREDF